MSELKEVVVQESKEVVVKRKEEIRKIEERLKNAEKRQEVIDSQFFNFGKCQVACVETVDDEGNKITGLKSKGLATAEERLNYYTGLAATQDTELTLDIMGKAISAQPTKTSVEKTNVVCQALADFEPRDSLEARLVLQAHTLYVRGMNFLARADQEDYIPQMEFFTKYAIKFFRLHNETVEAINRHRRKGEQRVVVQHVNVEGGGQAVVSGSMSIGKGGSSKKNNGSPQED